MTVHNTPWMYSAIPPTKSLVTLKTFLPKTTGSMKLMSLAPEENTVLLCFSRQLGYIGIIELVKDPTAHTIITG